MVWFALWLWGVGASSIDVIKSARARKYIMENDPDFYKYMQEKDQSEKNWLNIKSIAKIFIPIYNVIHPIRLLFDRSFELADIWKLKIKTHDEKRKKRIESRRKKEEKKLEKAKEENKTNTQENTQNKTNTQANVQTKPVAEQTTKPAVKPAPSKFTSRKPVQTVNKFQSLIDYCDRLNQSAFSTQDILKYYIAEYKAAKVKYLEAKKKNDTNAMQESYAIMKIMSDKSIELKSIRNIQNNQQNAQRKIVQ